MTINFSVLKVAKVHQHATFQGIPFMRSPNNAQKPQICQNSANIKKKKSTNQNHKLIRSEGNQNIHHAKFQAISFMAFSENARKPQIWPFTKSK